MLKIGEAAAQSGINAKLIRHYESIGLIPKPARTDARYRAYTESDVHLLRFVKRARGLGFSMKEIKTLVGLWRNRSRSSAEVKRLAVKHMQELELKIREMQQMVDSLGELAQHCHGDHRPECPILEDLARTPPKDHHVKS